MAVLEVIMWYREMVKIIQNRWRIILAIIVLVILIWTGYVWLGRWPDWTGFGEYISPAVLPNQTFQPAKTLWDWMQLLIIPAILVGGAYWLNESARKQEIEIAEKSAETEREIASDNRKETALQTYLDKMTELLLDKKLRESEVNSEIRAVARARTLTVLRRLDGERKGALLQFLYEADLIDKDKIAINLNGAKLSFAYLNGANLGWADLGGAILNGAKLGWAKYTKNTANNRGTIWPDNFDPVAAGAICVNE